MERKCGAENQTSRSYGGSNSLDRQLPAVAYLCQVDESISCGACCGLYNVADTSRQALEKLLKRRTSLFSSIVKSTGDVDKYCRRIERTENQARPFAGFHHCPFLGLTGRQHSTVGCLLHPEANGGQDMRGLSYYGGMACRVYFCRSTKLLPDRYKAIVKTVAPDWHWYGLVITEHRLISAILSRLENMLPPGKLDELVKKPDFRKALCRLLGLKIDWPYRPEKFNTCCHHLFADNHPGRPELPPSLAKAIAPDIRAICESIGSKFTDNRQLLAACRLIDQYFEAVLKFAARPGACL